MANRLVLSADHGLKVSKAGFNVLTAADTNLLFNSDWRGFGVWMSGSVTTSGNTRTVSFGKTFPTPPLVTIAVKMAVWTPTGMQTYWVPWYAYSASNGNFPVTDNGWDMNITTTQIQFYGGSGTWRYIIWDQGV